jgi:NTE family protein
MNISVALGGGGIKGIAHIGVLDCLEQAGFQIRAVAGTSAGGLVGAFYAAGYHPKQIQEFVENLDQDKIFGRSPEDGPSFLGYTGLVTAMTQFHGENTFEDLKIPFACTAVDLRTASEIFIDEGRVIDAVLATIAVPGIFPSKMRGEADLIDGGVLDPVPVTLARCMAPTLPVVAVPLNPHRDDWDQLPAFNILPPGTLPIPTPLVEGIARLRVAQAFRTFLQSMDISARMVTELRLEIDKPEIIIRPDVHKYGMLDRVNPKELYDAGYAAAEQAIPEIRKVVSWPRQVMRILRQPSRPRPQRSEAASLPPTNLPPVPPAPAAGAGAAEAGPPV